MSTEHANAMLFLLYVNGLRRIQALFYIVLVFKKIPRKNLVSELSLKPLSSRFY